MPTTQRPEGRERARTPGGGWRPALCGVRQHLAAPWQSDAQRAQSARISAASVPPERSPREWPGRALVVWRARDNGLSMIRYAGARRCAPARYSAREVPPSGAARPPAADRLTICRRVVSGCTQHLALQSVLWYYI